MYFRVEQMSKNITFWAQGSHYEKRKIKYRIGEDKGEACSVEVGLEITV